MFKKVLQSISKSLSRQTEAPVKPATINRGTPPAASSAPSPVAVVKGSASPAQPASPQTPEELLGIDPRMSKEQIRDHLKLLYRRYNRAASSLDNTTRLEADAMLDAIVSVREKNFGEI